MLLVPFSSICNRKALSFAFNGCKRTFINQFSNAAYSTSDLKTSSSPSALCHRINYFLKHELLANMDSLLDDLLSLHNLGFTVPYFYLQSSVNILASRFDPYRIELLIHLAYKNESLRTPKDIMISSPVSPFQRLIHHSICILLKQNHTDEALNMFARLRKFGFVPKSSQSFDLFFKSLSSTIRIPKINFIATAHIMATNALSNQNYFYYCHVVKSLSKFLERSDESKFLLYGFKVAIEILDEIDSISKIFDSKTLGQYQGYSFLAPELQVNIVFLLVSMLSAISKITHTKTKKLKAIADSKFILHFESFVTQSLKRGDSILEYEFKRCVTDRFDLEKYFDENEKTIPSNSVKPISNVDILVWKIFKRMSWTFSIDSVLLHLSKYLNMLQLSQKFKERNLREYNFSDIREGKFTANDTLELASSVSGTVLIQICDAYKLKVLEINKLAEELQAILRKNGFDPTHHFYSKWMQSLLRRRSIEDFSLIEAKKILENISETDRNSEEVKHAIMCLISNRKGPYYLEKAYEYIKDALSNNERVASYTIEKLLLLSAKNLSSTDHKIMLTKIENTLRETNIELMENEDVLTQLFHSHGSLGHTYKCFEILHLIRSKGIRPKLGMYFLLINSLCASFPKDKSDTKLLTDPLSMANWIFRDLQRDGREIEPRVVEIVLRLFTKASGMLKINRESYRIIQQAETMILGLSEGINGNRRVRITEQVVTELIRACSRGHLFNEAFRILKEYPVKYNYKLTSASYVPIISMLGADVFPVEKLDEIHTELINKNYLISSAIVNSFVHAYMSKKLASEALDKVQELFNQHNARPSCGAILRILDYSLKKRDKYEAMRVVTVIQQLFTEKSREKTTMNGPDISYYISRDENYSLEGLNQEAEAEAEEDHRDVEGYESLFEQEQEYFANVRIPKSNRNSPTWGFKTVGILSERNIIKRFKLYGVEYGND